MAAAQPCPPRATLTGQETDARQVFRRLAGCWTYWGWKGGYFSAEADARAFFDENCYMLAAQMAAPNSPQWFNTGLHWAYGIEGPAQGHYRVDPLPDARGAVHVGLRASGPARLLHPVGQRRSRQRRRHHGPLGPRGPHLQIRLGHRLQFLRVARRRRAALRRRSLQRPDELPEDRRPRRRGHQVGRHHAPRGQDGRPGSRSSRHRAIRQLESHRGTKSRGPGHRLATAQPPPQRHLEGVPPLAEARRTP